MEKRTVFLFVGIVLVAVLVLAVYKLTGQATLGPVGTCLDSDGGVNYYVKGTASYTNRDKTYTDYCRSRTVFGPKKWLNEYYCSDVSHISSKNKKCEKGCIDGACVK